MADKFRNWTEVFFEKKKKKQSPYVFIFIFNFYSSVQMSPGSEWYIFVEEFSTTWILIELCLNVCFLFFFFFKDFCPSHFDFDLKKLKCVRLGKYMVQGPRELPHLVFLLFFLFLFLFYFFNSSICSELCTRVHVNFTLLLAQISSSYMSIDVYQTDM